IYAFVGPRMARLLRMFSAVLGLVFAGALIYYGSRLFMNTLNMGQLSTAMQIPVAYVYFVIPMSGAFMLIRYMLVFKQLALYGKYEPLTTAASAGRRGKKRWSLHLYPYSSARCSSACPFLPLCR